MLAEIRVTPVDSRTSFARLIAQLVPILDASPLEYQVHAMGTTVEGTLPEILALVSKCHEQLRKSTDRLLLELSIDDRDAAEGEIVRSLHHLQDLEAQGPLERLIDPGSDPA